MTTASCSRNTSFHDTKQVALRRVDERIARHWAAQVDNADEGAAIRSFGASRGIIHSTLARWSIGYMPAAHEHGWNKSLAALGLGTRELLQSGLFAQRFAGSVVIPVRDQNGGICGWIAQPVNIAKPFVEETSDLRDGAKKDLLLAREPCSCAVHGGNRENAYPLVFSPGFLEMSAGAKLDGAGDRQGMLPKNDAPIIVCADVVDAVLVDQAGAAAIAIVDAGACPKQLDLLVRLLTPHAKAHRRLFACFNTSPEGKHRDKGTEASLGDCRMARFLAGMWERNKELARSIRVISLPAGDSEVDLAGVLKGAHDAAAAAGTEIIKAQRARLREMAASSSESIEFLIQMVPPCVPAADRASVFDMTGLKAVAAHDPDVWREIAPRVAKAAGIDPKDRNSRAKRVVKKTAEAENVEKGGRDKRLARYTTKSGTIRATYAAVHMLLRKRSALRLVFDTMTLATSEILDEERPWELSPLDDERMSDLQLDLAELRCDAQRQTVEHAASAIALKNRLNPVECYLRALPRHSGERDWVAYVSSKVLGITAANGYTAEQIDLYTLYLRKWFRSAVARAVEPGCKADLMLVFSGTTQGQFKSSFARALVAVNTWYGVPDLKKLDRDSVMAMRFHWINEVPEIEKGSFYRNTEGWKAFLSCEADTIRPAYWRRVARFPRASVLFGTTNQVQILADPTGSRRFLCIPICVPIRLDLLEPIRDALWAQIFAEYDAWVQRGRLNAECPWWLTPEERQRQDADGAQFEVDDPVKEKFLEWLNGQPSRWLTARQIVVGAKIGSGKDGEPTQGDCTRVGIWLARLGWRRTKRGEQRGYEAPAHWQAKPR
ncbi:VapE domain-containing protein [Nannocystis punicea]|uniref:VapE family protein n=1 Tax=Nannocystis punicea TaxID=2995304 RepID=A0ABY7GY11_9BACT|nr:VapE domain-containing protein [Nannocystis poenicansa]WAS91833.1 VapE family protein [Nannocystis poenicansa]